MSQTDKNQQRLEDMIEVLKAGRENMGALAAMIAAKAIANKALKEYEQYQNLPLVKDMHAEAGEVYDSYEELLARSSCQLGT